MFIRKISDGAALFTVVLAVIFWYVTFSLKLLNFWLSMAIAASILSILAINLGGWPFKKRDFNVRAVVIGIVSALILYGIFWLGNIISQWLFGFAKSQVSSIYDIRTQGELIIITLVLLFITSPAEEIFWRGFLQRWAMQRFGGLAGWLLGAVIYAGVHISSGNFMLTMAALVAGLFWGYIYWQERSVVPVLISHALWTVAIFVLFPVM